MEERIENRNVTDIRRLASPAEAKEALPLRPAAARTVQRGREAVRNALHGRDPRFVAIVGPCSIHDPDAALDYAGRLADTARRIEDAVVVVMRTYLEKPRTTLGWKGIINDPRLDGSCDVPSGLDLARRLLLDINELGVPCASELLDPVTPQYVADCLSWAAIGARTAASQTHREMASGLSMPVGLKNGIDGSVDVAADALEVVRHPHTFFGIDADGRASVVRTRGNADAHLVLRGGGGRANYGADDVRRAVERLGPAAARRPVMVDCSHGNSGKDPARQPAVCRAVLEQVRNGQGSLLGLMLESHLRAGRQRWTVGEPFEYGLSITDGCIGWDETEALLHETAEAVRRLHGPGMRAAG